MNGEHVAVIGSARFDALTIENADENEVKRKYGRSGDVHATARKTRMDPVKVGVDPEGRESFSGKATCVLVGNVGTLLGGLKAFADALPFPDRLDVATAEKFKIELKSNMPWGFDGGDRTPTEIFEVRCHSGAARICQPNGAA